MSEAIRARFYVSSVWQVGASVYGQNSGTQVEEKVELQAVYSSDKSDPNYSFSAATPQAKVELTITNKDAWGFFRPGATFDALFSPTSDEEADP